MVSKYSLSSTGLPLYWGKAFICLFKEQVTVPILKMGKSMYIFTYIFVPLYQGKKNNLDTF